MGNLSKKFDWKKSSAHVNFLIRYFIGPNDIEHVMSFSPVENLREKTKVAIQRFIEDNSLVFCGLEESLYRVFTANDLKKFLKEKELKQSGSKPELIERLINHDRLMAEKLVSNYKIMKCSAQALNFLDEFKENRKNALNLAKKRSFEFLLKGRIEDAFMELLKYKKEYLDCYDSQANYSYEDEIERINFVISSSPKVLGKISQNQLDNLRAATCMSILWYYDELSESWLPDDFETHLGSNTIAINYLKCNAEMRKNLANCQRYTDKVKITFSKVDVDSCALCKKLKNQVFDLKNFPELPLENCTSQTGCKCEIEEVYDEQDTSECENVLSALTEVGNLELFTKLIQLKKLFDNDLITEEEYQQKKTEILSRL